MGVSDTIQNIPIETQWSTGWSACDCTCFFHRFERIFLLCQIKYYDHVKMKIYSPSCSHSNMNAWAARNNNMMSYFSVLNPIFSLWLFIITGRQSLVVQEPE